MIPTHNILFRHYGVRATVLVSIPSGSFPVYCYFVNFFPSTEAVYCWFYFTSQQDSHNIYFGTEI
jgi:hypothetical protein